MATLIVAAQTTIHYEGYDIDNDGGSGEVFIRADANANGYHNNDDDSDNNDGAAMAATLQKNV